MVHYYKMGNSREFLLVDSGNSGALWLATLGGGAVDQPQSLSLSLLACLFTLYGGEAFTAAPCLSPLPRHSLTWPWSWRRRSLPLVTVEGCLFSAVNTWEAILVCC